MNVVVDVFTHWSMSAALALAWCGMAALAWRGWRPGRAFLSFQNVVACSDAFPTP